MATLSAKQVLSNLYGLMMEINLHRSDEDVLAELQAQPDAQVEKHLLRVKQLNAKLRAEATKVRYGQALEQLRLLKERGLAELQKLLQPHERAQLQPLFRKFEELTPEDEAAILEDQELLQLMDVLKRRIDEHPEP